LALAVHRRQAGVGLTALGGSRNGGTDLGKLPIEIMTRPAGNLGKRGVWLGTTGALTARRAF